MARKRDGTIHFGVRKVTARGVNTLARANRHNYAKGVRAAGNSHKKGKR